MLFAPHKTILDLFRTQVSERPDAIALKDGQRFISYRDLDRLSNRVAHRLLALGIRNEEIVALLIDKSFQFVIASLGVMKAGGSYLPMDPRMPDQRLEFTLSDSGARFLLAWKDFAPRCAGYGSDVIVLDETLSSFEGDSENDPAVSSDPNRRAYIIYTSGSTGKPKGVEIEHHSLTNLISVYHNSFGMTPLDRVTLTANVAFDVSVGDLWPTLAAGATVLVPPKDLFDKLEIPRVIDWVDTEKASISFMPTAMMPLLMEAQWPVHTSLRFMITGGDTLRRRPMPHLRFKVVNGYGPTENTVWSTFSIVSPEGSGLPPIGHAIGNVSTYILDNNLQPVHPGDAGELYLGGVQVARGYFNRKELTEEKFISDPFATSPGARMYHTGDWARILPDGEIEFLGRRDDQIQIGGIRIELGEIEAGLLAHSGVAQACCRPLLKDGAVIGTTAHVVLVSSYSQEGIDVELKKHLGKSIDPRVIPHRFIVHKAFPMTPQGKLDRAALDAKVAFEVDEVDEVDEVASIWRANLPKSPELLRDDLDFFEIGGISLAAAALLVGLEKTTGKRLPLSVFRFQPTLSGLRRALAELQTTPADVLTLSAGGESRPIYCLYHASGDVNAYMDLARELGAKNPVYGILSPAYFDESKAPATMEEAAGLVVSILKKEFHETAPALIGFSWAGLLAFEVARQWVELEGGAPFVCVLGMAAPFSQVTRFGKLLHMLRWLPSWLWEVIRDGSAVTRLASAARRFSSKPAFAEAPNFQEWSKDGLSRHHIEIGNRYHPVVRKPIHIDLIREVYEYKSTAHPLHPYSNEEKPDAGWTKVAGVAPCVTWIDSHHHNIVKPPTVSKLAKVIRGAMDRFYGV